MGGVIVLSVDCDGMLLSWRASTNELVDRWKYDGKLTSVVKVGKDRLAVGDKGGTIIVLEHE